MSSGEYNNNADDGTARIPVMSKPASLMEVGPNGNNLAANAMSRHPVDDFQRRMQSGNPFHDLDRVRHLYGSGLAMKLATERMEASRHENAAPRGLPSSGLFREVLSGDDVQLNFGDFMSLPQDRPDFKREDIHAAMERQLGM